MCGRFVVKAPVSQLATMFDLIETPAALLPRYNVAPTQPVPVVRLNPEKKGRELVMLKWGLIPHWAEEAAIGNRMINARADTVAEKPAFRDAFRHRRCLMVADGFYEWQKTNGKKQPYFIGLKDQNSFAFAGLWEHWRNPEGDPVESCALITTDANEVVNPIHDRMPVILHPKDYGIWLDPENRDSASLHNLLQPYPSEAMTAYPVSFLVNNPRNEDPKCIVPQEPDEGNWPMRFDWRLLVWLLVLSLIFWSAFFAWSYRPAKGPMTLESADVPHLYSKRAQSP